MADKPTTSDSIKKRQRLERTRSKLVLERQAFDPHWRDLGDYILPRRTRFSIDDDDQDGKDRRSTKIVDSTATRAARVLQSGLHSGASNPATSWFKLTTPDPSLAEFGPVKQWLYTVNQRMLTTFLKSNIYNILPTLYGDLGVFGSPAMSLMEDDKELIRGYSFPVGSFAYATSRRGIVDTFVMDYKQTVRQIVEEFGTTEGSNDIDWSGISAGVRNQWEKGNTESKVDIVWMISPNADADPDGFESKDKPWASCYWEQTAPGADGIFLRESGFNEFPILAPRWHVTGYDWYASDCPGMTCLPDVRALQVMQRRKAQAVEIGINPSLQGPATLRNHKVSLLPGGITYLDNVQLQQGGLTPIRKVDFAALQFFIADIQDVRQGINESFYKDLFLMMANTDRRVITAREVAERHEEKLLVLGPTFGRMNDELYDPAIDRTYAIMDRAGEIPPAPKELENMQLKVEYTSLLAQALKLVNVGAVDRFLQSTLPLIQIFPEVKHKIRIFGVVDEYAEMLGVNPKLVVPDDEATQAAQAEEKQRQQAIQAAHAEQVSKTAKNLAGSNLEDDNALKRMLEGKGVQS